MEAAGAAQQPASSGGFEPGRGGRRPIRWSALRAASTRSPSARRRSMLDQMDAARLAALTPQERAQKLASQAEDYLDRGLLLEAERLYQAAVAADRKFAEAHAGLAEVRERTGDAGGRPQGGAHRAGTGAVGRCVPGAGAAGSCGRHGTSMDEAGKEAGARARQQLRTQRAAERPQELRSADR